MNTAITHTELVRYFENACTPLHDFRVGLEWEKELVDAHGQRLPFHGPGGIEAILYALSERYHWDKSFEGEHLVALSRDGDTITLEPGGQIELSPCAQPDLASLDRALRTHLAELTAVQPAGSRILSTAYTPIQPVEDIPFLPKGRYAIMRDYLPTRGGLAHGMMKGTTSVQATVDYASEADCSRKLDAAMALSPLALAMTANSPIRAGVDSGLMSCRARCWRDTDPDRTGLLGDLMGGGFSFEKYVDWLLDVPMMFRRSGDTLRAAHGASFRRWMEQPGDQAPPTLVDFEIQLGSVFPEVRLKTFLELRSCDNGSRASIVAIGALWKGLLTCDRGLDEALDLATAFPPEARGELHRLAMTEGLTGRWHGRSLAQWSRDLLDVAARCLDRLSGPDEAESQWLAPLHDAVEQGCSPAAHTRELFKRLGPSTAFLDAVVYDPQA